VASRQQPKSIVVGVDGSSEATGAVQYAADSAQLRALSLLVVHAYPILATAAVTAEALNASRAAAHRLVEDVLSNVTMPTTLRVDVIVEPGSPLTLLRGLARTAELMVIGGHHFNVADQLLAGPLASPLAATAVCPVIVVPKDWQPRPNRHVHLPPRRPIIIALDGETAAEAALQLTFEEAELRGSSVVALHVEPLESVPAAVAEYSVSIAQVLAGARQDHPDIDVRTILVPGEPSEAIVAASANASLMVVGRPHRSRGGGRWSRSVARAVLERSLCPLAIVPHDNRTVADSMSSVDRRTRGTA
jgi:nucleotide-binding universal stress UspA family protein